MPQLIILCGIWAKQQSKLELLYRLTAHFDYIEKAIKNLMILSTYPVLQIISQSCHTILYVPHLSVVLIYIWTFSSCHENLTKWSNNHAKPRNCLPLKREQVNRAHACSSNLICFCMNSYFFRLVIWRLSMTLLKRTSTIPQIKWKILQNHELNISMPLV